MKISIWKDKNLKTPKEVFNFLGNQKFGEEWTELPLQILQGIRKKPKHESRSFRRDKHMADTIYKMFVEFLNGENVTIYVRKKEGEEPKEWKGQHCSLERKYFLLIDQEIHPKHGPMDMDFMEFWIEMPKEPNPLSFKKAGAKIKHNKEYMQSIFSDVIKTIEGKITHEKYADELAQFLKGKVEKTPQSTWVGNHLSEEIKEENIKRGHA